MIIALVLTIIILVGNKVNSAAVTENNDFNFEVPLNYYRTVILKWKPYNDRVTFQIEAKTQGFVGFGISPNGGMEGSDILVCFFDRNNKPRILDMHGIGETKPVLDLSQDYVLNKAQKNETHLIFNFSRKWNTCDDKDMKLSNQSNGIIWAMHDQAPYEDRNDFKFNYHGSSRGAKFIYLNSSNLFDRSKVKDAKEWKIQTNKISFKNGSDTAYWCSIVKFPAVEEKHHIIGYDVVIPEEYLNNVHHIVLYTCPQGATTKQFYKYIDHKGLPCYKRGFPSLWNDCRTVSLVWTVGNVGYNEPDHIGIPIEANRDYFYLMETHFDNTDLLPDIHPYGGLTVFYTHKLRAHDGAVLQVGATVSEFLVIPKGQQEWKAVFHCDSECFKWNKRQIKNIKIYALTPHTHLLGKKLLVQLIRNGTEVETLSRDNHYNFDFQRTLVYETEKQILPGDKIMTTCQYASNRKIRPTFGGLGTSDEMCLMFFHYYPRISLSKCTSAPPKEYYEDSFRIKIRRDQRVAKTVITKEKTIPFRKYITTPNTMKTDKIEKIRKFLLKGKYDLRCMSYDKDGALTITTIPKNYVNYETLPEENNC